MIREDWQREDASKLANDLKRKELNHVNERPNSNQNQITKQIRLVSDEELTHKVNDNVVERETAHEVIEIKVTKPATSATSDVDIDEFESSPSNAFIRPSYHNDDHANVSTSAFSRLSTAIRRSLRLGPKRTTTRESQHRPPQKTPGTKKGAPFSQFTNLKRETFEEVYGTSKELLFLLQMNRISQVKKFVRHNDWPVSHEIRADLWRLLCHNKDFDSNKLLYIRQLEDLTKSGVKTFRPLFLSMDGMVVDDHGLRQEGAVSLQRLLIVIECVRPEIRYVPILYPLCAMFLHYMNAEDTFACVNRLLSQGHTFVLQSELAVYASCHTLLSLLKKHKKSVYTMLKRRVGTTDDTKLAEVFSQWNAWIFKFMPFEYLVRVIDCFLVEGHKMLLRVVLSLVYIWYKNRTRLPVVNSSTTNGPVAAPIGNNNNSPIINNSNTARSSLMRSPTMQGNAVSKLSTSVISSGGGDINKLSPVDQNIAEINEQITTIAQNCPISIQTLLDMSWAIRNFKHSTFEQRQKHYENKFREQVARIRSEKSNGRPLRSVYTAAFESKIIDTEAASELMAALPSRFQLETPQLLFRLSEHGASFVQLWTQIDEAEQSLLLIRSTHGDVFGAYCSSCWNERRDVRERARTRYFGTGESFVWRLQPDIQLPVIYQWAGRHNEHPDITPQMFMTAGDRFMIIGSGGEGDAIAIRDELSQGLSYPCDTFGSPVLTFHGNAFNIDELEVFQVVGTSGGLGD